MRDSQRGKKELWLKSVVGSKWGGTPRIYTCVCLRRVIPGNIGDPGKLSFDSGPASLTGDFDVISSNLIFPISEIQMAQGCFI